MQEKFVVKGVIKCDCGNPACRNTDKFYIPDNFRQDSSFTSSPFSAKHHDKYIDAQDTVNDALQWTIEEVNKKAENQEQIDAAMKGILFQVEKIFVP